MSNSAFTPTVSFSPAVVQPGVSSGLVSSTGLPGGFYQFSKIYAASNSYSFISGNNVGTTTAVTGSGTIATLSNSALRLTANVKCMVTLNWTLPLTTLGARLYVGLNGQTMISQSVMIGSGAVVANGDSSLAGTIVLSPSDVLYFCVSAGNVASFADIYPLNVVCQRLDS